MKYDIHGIFILDKPIGVSSNQALQSVKRLFQAKKAGHTGSLDPLATGMLPICFGEATKYSQHLLDADKCYDVTAVLGLRTDTGDSEGQVISERALSITRETLLQMLPKFTGVLDQTPPMYSALKHHGKPLYEYARQGQSIERASRQVTIYTLDLLGFNKNIVDGRDRVSLRVSCSKGTYIRSLIDDMGEYLECGAHVIALRRLWVHPFQHFFMMSLNTLESINHRSAHLLPVDQALSCWPIVCLDDDEVKRLLRGADFNVLEMEGWARFYTKNGQFLGVAHVSPDRKMRHKRLIAQYP
ncbi:MAG: tRNA pseudouridine(55) synthase TruB [Gammaproteobacteria bacterium]|nr:tRNA pseudouridine(55) synthase TruB [Gammaproteobacteria bacterium]